MILTTDRLILRPWREEDEEALFDYAKDPMVGPPAGWPPHSDVDESRQIILNVLRVPECYAVCLKEDDVAIGSIQLKLAGDTSMTDRKDECELGYCLNQKFWGRGIMPEAGRELLRHAFADLGMRAVWCGYYDGNAKSSRVQEKLGFSFHHTRKDVPVPLMNEVRIEHTNLLTKEDWERHFTIVKLSERRELAEKAAEWFSEKWGIPAAAYLESIEESFVGVVPAWYLCLDGRKIISGIGVIENDSHNRPDLTPNVCAVYTEPEYRGLGIAGKMLRHVCEDMHGWGIDTLYLLTDHTGFYERYGWEFLCKATGDGEEEPSRMYIHKYC